MQSIENTKAYRARAATTRAVALMSASVTAMALFAAPAHAQGSSTQPADAASDEGNPIIVTGSRIARPELEASVPVAVVSSKAIEDAGQSNLLDAVRDLPIAGQSADRSASNFLNSGNGEATINLRNLGASRTLVLINGRRSVGVPGGSAVDLNNIPTDLIDHVEIATGGTSAVYGSDAVAGVVNIILKNKFEGLEFHGQDMISTYGDGNRILLSGTGGWSFGGGVGHVVANFSYVKENGVASSDRDYSKNDSPGGSAYSPQGVFFDANGDAFTFDSNNNVEDWVGAPGQRYNRASQRLLTTPVKRYSASLLGDYEFSKSADLYVEFSYNKTKANGHIEPLAVDDSGAQGESVYNFDGSAFAGIPVSNNPFVPATIAAAAGPGTYLDFYKRSLGIFDRSPNDDRDYYRGVIGLKGDVGSGWNYDLSYEHSQVRDDTTNGSILMNNYGAALQTTTLNGQTVCADAAARAAGCVPINIFGLQTYTAAQLNWLTTYEGGVSIPGATIGQSAATAEFLQNNYQDVVSLAVTGTLFRLPAGPVGVAAGGEYHREKVSELYDPFTRSGWSGQQLNGNEVGSYDSKEAFLELNVPLLGGMPLIHELSIEGAARYADYSTVGSVWSYKFGGNYAPSPDIRFRAIYARAVRAPNLNELYSPQANTAQQVIDPCDQDQGAGSDVQGVVTPQIALPAACTSIPGVSNYVAAHQYFTYKLAQVQTIFGLVGGNPNLEAEATNTFTAGATITPTFLRNFFLTADYYSIKVKNAISSIDPQISVTQCFDTGNPDFCKLVHRDTNGFITEVDQVYINAASFEVAGVDVQAGYHFGTHFFNPTEKVTLGLFYNHKFKQQQTPYPGGFVSDELGRADTYASQQLGTGFKDQFTADLDYATGPISVHYRLKYLGPVVANVPIPAFTYSDLQVKFDVDKRFQFYVGADNLFNRLPPLVATGSSQWPGTNTVADTYDLVGRMFYAGVKAKF